MELTTKSNTMTLQRRNTVKVPAVFVEEHIPTKQSKVDVLYGRNYSVFIVLPTGIKLSDRRKEIINALCNEPLA